MIRTKVIVTRLFPKGHIVAITLFGLVFTRDRKFITERMLNHELIHCAQQLEWLYLPFFVLYLSEWLWYFVRYRNFDRAYRAISFEREAYDNDHNLQYLTTRPHFNNYRTKFLS